MSSVIRTIDGFMGYLARAVGVARERLDATCPLGEQAELDSMRMTELAIVLEQELGMSLPDDLDLRAATPASLFEEYHDGARA